MTLQSLQAQLVSASDKQPWTNLKQETLLLMPPTPSKVINVAPLQLRSAGNESSARSGHALTGSTLKRWPVSLLSLPACACMSIFFAPTTLHPYSQPSPLLRQALRCMALHVPGLQGPQSLLHTDTPPPTPNNHPQPPSTPAPHPYPPTTPNPLTGLTCTLLKLNGNNLFAHNILPQNLPASRTRSTLGLVSW